MNVVITGASRGIGRLLATNLSASKIFLLYHIDSKSMEETVEKLKCDYAVFKCDVANEEQVKNAFDQIDGIDVLINNAGVRINSTVRKMTEEQWDEVMDVNAKGVFLCCKHAIPKMTRNSHIVNISAIVSRTGSIGASNYVASKGALESFTKSLALELTRDEIFVNGVSLGFFEIGLGTTLRDATREHLLEAVPLHRFGDPMEIVRAVEYLISSRYLVGSIINLSGGYYM